VRCIATLVVAATLLLAPRAGALTLADLAAGASFASLDGTLSFAFEPGSVTQNGSLPGSLVDYLVTPIVGGFQLSGPMAAANGSLGGLTLSYAVTPLAGLLVDGASLLVTGVVVGAGALAAVGETLSNGTALGAILAGFGGSVPTDAAAFAPVPAAEGVTGVQLLALGAGEVAFLQTLRQTFSLVAIPEAASGVLLGSGLFGLAWLGRARGQALRARR